MNLLKSLFQKTPKSMASVKRVPRILPTEREMTQGERERIAKWLELPETQMALSFLEAKRPSVFPPNGVDSSSRLYQLQGWATYRNELLGLATVAKEEEFIEEEFQSPDLFKVY